MIFCLQCKRFGSRNTKIQIYLHRLHLSCLAPPRYHQHQQPPPGTRHDCIDCISFPPSMWGGQVRSAQPQWRHGLDGGPKRHDPPLAWWLPVHWVPAWPRPSAQLSSGSSGGTRDEHTEAEACGENNGNTDRVFIHTICKEGRTHSVHKGRITTTFIQNPLAFS